MRVANMIRLFTADGRFADAESRDKATVMGFGLPLAVVISFSMVAFYAGQSNWHDATVALFIAAAFASATVAWLATASFSLVTHLMAGTMALIFGYSALEKGDLSYLSLMAVVPVSAAFYASPRVGLVWAVLSVLATLGVSIALAATGLTLPADGDEVSFYARFVLAVICVAGMASAFQISRGRTLARLDFERSAADAANRAKSRFLATISHDLRTPLNGILGTLEYARLEPHLHEATREQLETMYQSGATLLALINDLLDLSRVEAGRLELSPRPFELRDALEQVRRLHLARATEKGLSIRCEVAGEGALWLHGDVLRFHQVLHNLVGNAVKFTERGSICVEAHVTPEGEGHRRLVVSVRDSGRGMTPQQQASLFQPFSQVRAEDAASGSGLGLAISRALIEQMGGTLLVESALDVGSTMRLSVRLPVAHPPAPAGPPTPRAMLTGRVLVVDDNAVNRRVAVGLLAQLGLVAESVPDGRAALAAVGSGHWDLVLMDLQMPEWDGIETTRRLRETSPGRAIPIIALTASALAAELAACRAAGMEDTLTKPVRLDQLRAVLERWLRPTRRASSGQSGSRTS